MKHTKEQLREMSDSEQNKVLEKLTGRYCQDCFGKYIRTMDYCGNWNDIMPLAIEHGIMYEISENRSGEKLVRAFNMDRSIITPWTAISPQRAITSCLIMVLEGKL
jgi:hypothetical protein